jgi:Flp pilus assembly protein TadG
MSTRPARRTRRRDESGAVAIVVGAIALLLFGMAAMVVDLGAVQDTRRQAQNAADASSLAAANDLVAGKTITQAEATAKTYAQNNYGIDPTTGWTGCTDPGALTYQPTTPCISFDSSTAPTKVRVRMPIKNVFTPFATVLGIKTVPETAQARAVFTTGGQQPCGLCVLGGGTHNFQNGDATVNGADIYLNGNSDVSQNGLVASSGSIYVQGTAGGGLGNYTPDPITGVPAISDPLANITLPPASIGTLSPKTDPCGTGPTHGPGVYAGWSVSNGVCDLQPGLYVVRSGIVDLSGNSTGILRGTGVTIYLTCANGLLPRECNPGESGARFDASGNGSLQITAPTSGDVQGVALVADRNSVDPGNNTPLIRLTGNGAGGFTGAIYAKSATVQMNGNGCSSTYNSMLVVNDIAFNGNGSCLTMTYSVGQNPEKIAGNLRLDQ